MSEEVFDPGSLGDHADLAAAFEALGPWVTRFSIDGENFGGWYDATAVSDVGEEVGRIEQFHAAFPSARTILELGSLEGGHTLRLAGLPGVTRVVGVEGRPDNVERARFVLRASGISNVEVHQGDLDTFDLRSLGRFDAVFNCGLLYHLAQPWELLQRIARASRGMYLSTHYCAEGQENTEVLGYAGFWYGEYGLDDPLSGLGARSFWPTRAALFAMIDRAGFVDCNVTFEQTDFQHGPFICLSARTPRFVRTRVQIRRARRVLARVARRRSV